MTHIQKTILIIEDERVLAQALQMKLSKEGFTVEIANNGEEALKILAAKSIDFIVLDLLMPVMDGFTFLEQLQEKKLHIPLMVLSNLGQPSDQERLKQLGGEDFFSKSASSLSDIVAHIKHCLNVE
ncbi:response regulator [Candidatus Uhrbacteria bacterium]|nr:response regulator [Candidatus Uhrbacteria bacterium]